MTLFNGAANLSFNWDLVATGTFRAAEERPQDIKIVIDYVGEPNVPREIRRRRKYVLDALKKYGTPVVVKHMYNADDVEKGYAIASPNFSPVYKQTRHDDPLSYGVGYVSVEKSEDEWMTRDASDLIYSRSNPGPNWEPAPKYRGFGPGYLIYILEPDVAEDVFKLTETGVFIRIQSATAQAPWFPEMNDNDLLVNVVLDSRRRVVETHERFQLKMTTPVTMRGIDRKGRREGLEPGGNRYTMNQNFEMSLVPDNDILYEVPIDR